VNLTIQKGENVVVLGRSGVGKSVLIKCLVGLVEPDAGTIRILGKDVSQLNFYELDRLRAQVGFVFQSNALYDSMTVRENLEFPLRRHYMTKNRREIDALVVEALENVGLLKAIDLMPAELSGGMRKRIGLARAMILKPDIMLYDEPTTGLDPITAREIDHLMLKVQAKYGTSAIIITHDIACARLVGNRIVVLIDGVCLHEGSYEQLKNSSDSRVRAFFDDV
jgi:phospholipid/cholesterol/gamma-HCH transport system ATP-binding protein